MNWDFLLNFMFSLHQWERRNGNVYTQQDHDEVRDEWAKFVNKKYTM